MKRSDLELIKALFPVSKTVEKLSVDVEPHPDQIERMRINRKLEIRPTTDEAKLNKLEQDYLVFLQNLQPHWLGVQCWTFKIGDDCRFTPDFCVLDETGLRAIDTKACYRNRNQPHVEDDAMVKLKVAARLFPFIHFVIAWRIDSTWHHRAINP